MTTAGITGYRTLTEGEMALMNEGKELAELCGQYIEKLRNSLPEGFDHRWFSIGQTDIQKGFMSLMRGIARPTTF